MKVRSIIRASAVAALVACGGAAWGHEERGTHYAIIPPGERTVRQAEAQGHDHATQHSRAYASHAPRTPYEHDYWGRISRIDRTERKLWTRSWLGVGPEREFTVPANATIERWNGADRWEFENLGRGQHVHIMYDHEDGRDIVKIMRVSWMAQKR